MTTHRFDEYEKRAVNIALLGYLLYRFKALMPILSEHLKDQNGEILPYVLMGEITPWLVQHEIEGTDTQLVNEILEILEDVYHSYDVEIDNLIGASFLENLPNPDEPGASIRLKLGPKLKEQLRIIWPSDRLLD